MSRRVQISKRARTIAITTFCLVITGGALFSYDAAKGLVLSLWYSPKVTSHFEEDFRTISSRLSHDYSIAPEHRDTKKDCGPTSGYPSGGKYIFTCTVSGRTDVVADKAFVEKWRETSPALERYLLAKGWQKEWNENQPINEILENFNNSSSLGVNYFKEHGGIKCTLSLLWVMPESPNHLDVQRVCEMSRRTWGW